MSDEATIEELMKERDQLRGRVSGMEVAAKRQAFELALAAELCKSVAPEAASLAARGLALEARATASGDLAVMRLGLTVPTIVGEFLSSEGKYLVENAPREKPAAKPKGEAWDIERAKRDQQYMQEWQVADAAGFQRAWAAEIDRMTAELRASRIR